MMRLIAFVIILSVREVLGKESIAPTAPTAPTTAPTTAEPTSPTAIPTAAPSDPYDFAVRILATRQVWGAAMPVNKYGMQCEADSLTSPWPVGKECECKGGAARRKAAIDAARAAATDAGASVVAIDTGGYFFGSGLFFPTFKGDASQDLMARTGYDAFGLAFRDFTAGKSKEDPTGGELLAKYIEGVRAKHRAETGKTAPRAVATNLDLSDSTTLTEEHVAKYVIVPLAGGRELAVLCLVDPTHLEPMVPFFADRLLDYKDAVRDTLAELAARGLPDVIALIVPQMPFDATLAAAGGEGEELSGPEKLDLYIQEIVGAPENRGIDVVIKSNVDADSQQVSYIQNAAGDDVLVVPAHGNRGEAVNTIEAHFDAAGVLVKDGSSAGAIALGCDVVPAPDVNRALTDFHALLEGRLGETKGTLLKAFDGDRVNKDKNGKPAQCLKPSAVTLPGADHDVCGCRLAQCEVGGLIADAIRYFAQADVGFVNGGSIRGGLPAGPVSYKAILEMLPFLNDVTVIRDVPGAVIRAALTNAISRLNNPDAAADPSGRFLQVSATLKFDWRFDEDGVPTVLDIHVGKWSSAGAATDFTLLKDENTYKVATSTYIAGGGDGFDMFKAMTASATSLGLPQADFVATFLQVQTPMTPNGVDLSITDQNLRIAQKPRLTRSPTMSPSQPGEYEVTFLVTRQVWGAAMPVSKYGQQCEADSLTSPWPPDKECECKGGAARRKAAIDAARAAAGTGANVVAIDTGGYFFGSGLFFPTFKGDASQELMASVGYDLLGLGYRDFTAGVSASDATGGELLAKYIEGVRAKHHAETGKTLPRPVATNLDLSNSTTLTEEHVAKYAIVPLADGRELAVLCLVDPTHLRPLVPYFAARTLDFKEAVYIALVELERRENGTPDVVALIFPDLPHDTVKQYDGSITTDEIYELFIQDIVSFGAGIDVVIRANVEEDEGGVKFIKNLVQDDVMVAPARGVRGTIVDSINARFGADGYLVKDGSSAKMIELTCDVEADTATNDALTDFHANMERILGDTKGYLSKKFDGERVNKDVNGQPAFCSKKLLSVHVPGAAHRVCGCRLAQCEVGGLIADAIRNFAEADIGFVNGGSIRGGLPAGPISRKDVLEMLPFLNEVAILRNVKGSAIRAAFTNAISRQGKPDAAVSPSGRFLQVSATLKYEWRFENGVPTVGDIHVGKPSADNKREAIDFVLMGDDDVFTLATSTYLAGGGDDFEMFESYTFSSLGATQADTLADFIALISPDAPGIDLTVVDAGGVRVEQTPDNVRLQIALLCNDETPIGREECDHAQNMVQIINADDSLLKYATIVTTEKMVGCAAGHAREVFESVHGEIPDLTAVIGPSCSNDVQDVTDATWRQQNVQNRSAVVISGASTASVLSDDGKYTRLARLVTPDGAGTVRAVTLLADNYNWKRVAVLHDDSVWATGVANDFVRQFEEKEDRGEVIGNKTVSFSLSAFDSGALTGKDVLDLLAQLPDVKIVVLAAQPRVQRAIFAEIFHSKRYYGKGFGWITAWLSEDAFTNDDGKTNVAAVRGGEGLIGFIEETDMSTENAFQQKYLRKWAQVSGSDACAGGRGGSKPFCDADNDPTNLPEYTAFHADAVLLYALSLDKDELYRKLIGTDRVVDYDSLYAQMRDLGPFEGVSSEKVKLDATTGDRLGTLLMKNFKVNIANTGLRRLDISVTTSSAEFVTVGHFDSSAGISFDPTNKVVFPGKTSVAPSDRTPPPPEKPPAEMDSTTAVAIGITSAVLAVAGAGIWYWHNDRMKKKSAERLKLEQAEAAERARIAKVQADAHAATLKKKADEEKKKADEEKRKADEEKKKALLEQRRADKEKKKADEEKRKADEEKKKADEEKRKRVEQAKQLAEVQAQLNRFQKKMVGVHAVVEAFDARQKLVETPEEDEGEGEGGGGGFLSGIFGSRAKVKEAKPSAPPLEAGGGGGGGGGNGTFGSPWDAKPSAPPLAPSPPDKLVKYYWQEDANRISKHEATYVFQPGNWVGYMRAVNLELDEAYEKWKNGHGPATYKLDCTQRIPSRKDRQEETLGDNGCVFEIDFQNMTQMNTRSQYKRKMLRREEAVPVAPVAPVPASAAPPPVPEAANGETKAAPGPAGQTISFSGASGHWGRKINGIYDRDSGGEHLFKKRGERGVWLYLDEAGQQFCIGDDVRKKARSADLCYARADIGHGKPTLRRQDSDLSPRHGNSNLVWRVNINSQDLKPRYKSQRDAKVHFVMASGFRPKPIDLLTEDTLTLHKGQLIQVSKNRANAGWAYGSVIFDPVEDRPAVVIEGKLIVDRNGKQMKAADGSKLRAGGVAAVTGWFPTSHTAPPLAHQLQQLQKQLGGKGAKALSPPDTWEASKKSVTDDPSFDPQVAKLYTLPDGPEKQLVIKRFMEGDDTVFGAKQMYKIKERYAGVKIVKVERVENVSLWQSYAVKRHSVLQREKKTGRQTRGESRFERIWLFHGTWADTIPKIVQQGFNRMFCGKNATAYGKGVYFARDAHYSYGYCKPDSKGLNYMFLCRVTVGEYCQGHHNQMVPDVRKGHILYDSTVDTMRDNVYGPVMFVVYHDAQAYPEYLVTFKK